MPSSSSTSSFEPNRLERAPVQRAPRAAIGLLLVIGLVEVGLSQSRAWFSDRAAWQWKSKYALLDQGALDGDIAIVGTSVAFHGLDPVRMTERLGGSPRVVSLALNGMQLEHETQILERQLARGGRYQSVLLELREVRVDRESWLGGPFWRFAGRWGEVLDSGLAWHEPSLLLSFGLNRVLTSFAYRKGLDNWIFASVAARAPIRAYRDRNAALAVEMATRRGFNAGEFVQGLRPEDVPPPKSRPFAVDPAGEVWLNRLLSACDRAGIEVVILRPPAPPFVERDRRASGFDADYARYVDGLRARHPSLKRPVIAPAGYGLADFADQRHLSHAGARRLTDEVGDWLRRDLR